MKYDTAAMRERAWEDYGYKLKMMIERPRHAGKIDISSEENCKKEFLGTEFGSFESGRKISIFWVFEAETKKILECSYTLFASPDTIAAADMAMMLCKNKTPDEIRAVNYKTLEYFLRDKPSEELFFGRKKSSIQFVISALRYSMDLLEGVPESEDARETVCYCTGATLEYIKNAITDLDIADMNDLQNMTGAGIYCGECIESGSDGEGRRYFLKDILEQTRISLLSDKKNKPAMPQKPFPEMGIDEKKIAIDAIIDEHIRAMLVMDGGDMEILDIKENGDHTDIYIRYLGACSGCASANTGTLFAIEGVLKQKLDPNIRVLPL